MTGVGAVTAAMRRVSIGEKSPPFKRMICEVFTFKSMFAVIVVEDFFPPLFLKPSLQTVEFFLLNPHFWPQLWPWKILYRVWGVARGQFLFQWQLHKYPQALSPLRCWPAEYFYLRHQAVSRDLVRSCRLHHQVELFCPTMHQPPQCTSLCTVSLSHHLHRWRRMATDSSIAMRDGTVEEKDSLFTGKEDINILDSPLLPPLVFHSPSPCTVSHSYPSATFLLWGMPTESHKPPRLRRSRTE